MGPSRIHPKEIRIDNNAKNPAVDSSEPGEFGISDHPGPRNQPLPCIHRLPRKEAASQSMLVLFGLPLNRTERPHGDPAAGTAAFDDASTRQVLGDARNRLRLNNTAF